MRTLFPHDLVLREGGLDQRNHEHFDGLTLYVILLINWPQALLHIHHRVWRCLRFNLPTTQRWAIYWGIATGKWMCTLHSTNTDLLLARTENTLYYQNENRCFAGLERGTLRFVIEQTFFFNVVNWSLWIGRCAWYISSVISFVI